MEHRRSKLALFLAVQALAVAAMILALRAGRRPDCPDVRCGTGAPGTVVATALIILGELWILLAALRVDGPVWKTVVALGILALIGAPAVVVVSRGLYLFRPVANVAAGWHVAAGLLLLVTGAGGGASELFARLRRPDGGLADDRGSSAMWPLD